MDEKLKSLLERVVKLSTQNKEFGEALRRELGVATIVVPDKIENDDILNIEKYLGLDFYIDSKNSTVDYSFIDEEDVRDQLVSDNREMMRYRYGTRSHKIDFPEFCRYAHMQAEMLINYFYEKKDKNDFNEIKKHIRKYNEKAIISDKYTKITDITFSVKWFAFSREYNLKKISYNINFIRLVRNEISHRNRATNGDNEDPKTMKFHEWCQSEPFDSIIESLKIVAKTINDTCYEEQ